MALSISLDLAILGIKSLLKYRNRIDTILSLNEATTGIPFRLPPAPIDHAPHIDDMLSFFKKDQGKLILELKGLQEDFEKVSAKPRDRELQGPRQRLLDCYYESNEIQPTILGPNNKVNLQNASQGPSAEMRLAYYVVESQRLSRNPALTRVLLATADTLLEIAGENAGLFISNPKTQRVVETLLNEFAVKHDFDDDSTEKIFKKLLGAAIVSVSENQGLFPEKSALNILFSAISDVRETLGDDFVARIISLDGFERLVSIYLTHVAQDPSFITKDDLARKVLSATLNEIGENFKKLLDDPKAFIGVFEIGLATAAANVDGILAREFENKPLLAAVLSGIMKEIAKRGQTDDLFKRIAQGDLIPGLYRTVLETIAANPDELANTLGTKELITDLVTGLAEALSQHDISDLLNEETICMLASKSLGVLSSHPDFTAQNRGFATNLLKAVLKAGADSIKDGLEIDDLLMLSTAGIKAAADNIALLHIDETLAQILESMGKILSAENIKRLLTPKHRKDVLLVTLQAVATNPKVWEELKQKDLVKPFVESILTALSSDPTQLLSGPLLVNSIQKILITVARRGKQLIDQNITDQTVKILLKLTLEEANKQISQSVDGENLPDFLERVVTEFFKSPISLSGEESEELKKLFRKVLKHLEDN